MRPDLTDVLPPVLAVAFALGAVFSARAATRDRARARRSATARGVVAAVTHNSSQQVFPLVRFRTATGQPVEATPESTTNAVRFEVGQEVGLRYDPEEPTWIQVDGLPSGVVVGSVATVVLALGAVACTAATILTR